MEQWAEQTVNGSRVVQGEGVKGEAEGEEGGEGSTDFSFRSAPGVPSVGIGSSGGEAQ